ncbi:DUF6090 family protein [Urechidicola croceus]|uniref:Uncharacterized protein n=1 Tax=Urechidicola croceus TaxID=1850246 RepID=A0A1D8P5S8_9FLAO|nr:DUF6090 family protein [Urechidicola croceus]AOW19914.1 hypothetical protein LPB138_04110 [Urechidicola croceus]
MIKFFRNIRKNLLNEGKTSKYFKYAIGEIVLVVIGILIALSINNWNQNRISNNEEQTILKNIHSEFLQNKEVIDSTFEALDEGFNSSKIIMSLFGEKNEIISNHNIDSLIFNALETGSFRPSENTISDLLQSGRLQLLQNEKLKHLIYQWTRSIKTSDVRFERVEQKIDNELVPYLSKNYALKDIDMYGELEWKNKTLLKIDKYKIFKDIEFENILDDYMYRTLSSKNGLNELTIIINDILKETEAKND